MCPSPTDPTAPSCMTCRSRSSRARASRPWGDRCRQDYADQPAHPLLRPIEGAISVGRRGPARLQASRPAAPVSRSCSRDPVLFSLSIAENIATRRLARPGAGRPRRPRRRNAHEFIERLPQGYETQVGERGVKLSGGQRQRVRAGARVLEGQSRLIWTSPRARWTRRPSPRSFEALERLKQGRTVIVISHRSTTLAGCSAFLTVDGGRVVAQTTPAPVVAAPAPPACAPHCRVRETPRDPARAPGGPGLATARP